MENNIIIVQYGRFLVARTVLYRNCTHGLLNYMTSKLCHNMAASYKNVYAMGNSPAGHQQKMADWPTF